MSERTKITFHKGGTAEYTLPVNHVVIPDLWHIAQSQSEPYATKAILEVWHMAHNLLNHIKENEAEKESK